MTSSQAMLYLLLLILEVKKSGSLGRQPQYRLQTRTTAYWMIGPCRHHWTLACCELQLAKKLDSQKHNIIAWLGEPSRR